MEYGMTIKVTVEVSGALKANIFRNGELAATVVDDAKGGTTTHEFTLADGENWFTIDQGSQTKGVDNDNPQGGEPENTAKG